MPSIPQRIASAFAVLCDRYGNVTRWLRTVSNHGSRCTARPSKSSTPWRYCGPIRIDDLQRQLAEPQAQVQALQVRLKQAVEITPDTQDEFATVAQAEGVSLSVARRLLQVMAGSNSTPSVPTLGR